jgi:hypothetical protein
MAEQRCTDLGSSCICSEPLQATAYTEPSNDYKNPNDTSSLQCSQDGVSGGAITRTADDVVASTDATALAALPSGHSVARFMRAGDDHEGTFYLGNNAAVDSAFVRLAARWYIYHTPTYDFKAEGTCNNSKIAEFNNDSRVDAFTDSGNLIFHTYNYLTFDSGAGPDCCTSGPGPDNGQASSSFKGKWWRFEAVLTNRAGPDYRMRFYGQNVTDGDAEQTLIDTNDNSQISNLTPPSLMSQIMSNNHRSPLTSGICRGWVGLSHYMMAGWTSDAGQRIGAASEIETGGGGGGSGTRGSGLGGLG